MTSSQPPSIQDLKRTLIAAGLEIYRTRPDAVHLAERPRDNQILDAGISVRPAAGPAGSMEVRVILRCQRSDFPREPDTQLFDRVRDLARDEFLGRGYREIDAREEHMLDPGDREKRLDTWYEITFGRTVDDVDQAIGEAKRALRFEKVVRSS